jgi:rod shape-determining protein MreC
VTTRSRIALACAAAAAAAAYFALAARLGPSADRAARAANAPYGRFVRAVPGLLSRVSAAVTGGAAAASERDALAAEVERLRASQLETDRLRAENDGLRRALGLVSEDPRLVCAEVLSRGGATGWRDEIRVACGSRDGVAPGQPVLAAAGLVGRVLSVTERTADILLLSDANSRLSCVVETPAGALRGVVQGGGIARGDRALEMLHASAPFTVEYLDKDAAVAPGARVLTSGLGGVYPAGLPVGVVAEAGPDDSRLFQRAVVAPYVDFGSLRRVFVMRGAIQAEKTR